MANESSSTTASGGNAWWVVILVAVIGGTATVLGPVLKKGDEAKPAVASAPPAGPPPSTIQVSNGADSQNIGTVNGNVNFYASHTPANPESEAQVAGDHVRACQKAHGMQRSREARAGKESENTTKAIYMSCEWPAPSFAESDGFSKIEVVSEFQPQYPYSATDCQYADIFRGPCERYIMSYDSGHMGDYQHGEPFSASPGQLLSAFNGTSCNRAVCCHAGDDPDDHGPGLYRYPENGEVFVMRNDHITLGDVRCAP